MQKGSSTANTVLIILLVIVVGLVVWYFTAGKTQAPTDTEMDNGSDASLEINLGGSGDQN